MHVAAHAVLANRRRLTMKRLLISCGVLLAAILVPGHAAPAPSSTAPTAATLSPEAADLAWQKATIQRAHPERRRLRLPSRGPSPSGLQLGQHAPGPISLGQAVLRCHRR